MNITREQFKAYEDVRVSGVTNMFAIKTVQELSGLERDDVIQIMNKYSELKKRYND